MSKCYLNKETDSTDRSVKSPGEYTFNNHQKNSLHTPGALSSGSDCKSPKPKRTKMVHKVEGIHQSCTDDINDVYQRQLESMRTRVNLLAFDENEEFIVQKCQSAPSRLEVQCKISSLLPSLHGINEASDQSLEEFKLSDESLGQHFGNFETEISSDIEDDSIEVYYKWTPRMFEVPPKKQCTRSITPIISPINTSAHTRLPPMDCRTSNNVKYKSIWTNNSPGMRFFKESKSDNIESSLKHALNVQENLDKIEVYKDLRKSESSNLNVPLQKPKPAAISLHLEPRVIVVNTSSSTSDISVDRILKTPSDFSSISTPSLIVSPLSSASGTVNETAMISKISLDEVKYLANSTSSEYSKSNKSQTWIEEIPEITSQAQFNRTVSGTEVPRCYIAATQTTTIKDISAGLKRILKVRKKNNAESNCGAADEDLESSSDEVEWNVIHYSDYDVPIKCLGEIPSNRRIYDIVSNLALHVFKSKDTVEDASAMQDTTEAAVATAEETSSRMSFKNLAQEVSVQSAARRKEIEKILKDNIKDFRDKNVGVERRQQTTSFDYYNVNDPELQIESDPRKCDGCGYDLQEKRFGLGMDRVVEDSEVNYNDVRVGCCNLRSWVEFMFRK